METTRSPQTVIGALLILLGGWLLVTRLIPGLEALNAWPMIIVAFGLGMLAFGVLIGTPALAVPASILAGIGGILTYQQITGNWGSWAYIWTLIPGFVGIGLLITGLLEGDLRSNAGAAGWLILISAVLFGVFGSFLGGGTLLGPYWPVLLIIIGLILLGRELVGRRLT